MKKLLMIVAVAGMTSLAACDTQTGKNTNSAGVDSEQNSSGSNYSGSVVNGNPNDTTGASATEETQTNVGNSRTRGEQNTSNSRTTQNQVLGDSTKQQ